MGSGLSASVQAMRLVDILALKGKLPIDWRVSRNETDFCSVQATGISRLMFRCINLDLAPLACPRRNSERKEMTRVFILGASGTGTSTLGSAVAADLSVPHLDVDHFYWLPTNPPFTSPRPVADRVAMLGSEIKSRDAWVLEGSLLKWGDCFIPLFDLVVFLTVEPSIRMERLRLREQARYGARIHSGGDMEEHSSAFLAWAAAYDTAGAEQRSLAGHEDWLSKITAPTLRLDGAESLEQLREAVVTATTSLSHHN